MRACLPLVVAASLLASSALAQSTVKNSAALPCGEGVAPAACQSSSEPPPQLLGTWRLNVAKSKYSPGPPLRAEMRVYSRSPEGVSGVVTRTYADGEMERYEYVANFG